MSKAFIRFDTHVHFFPDHLAPKAMAQLVSTCGLTPCTDGTYDDTIQKLNDWSIQGAIALHIATTPHQQNSVNNFAAERQSDRLVCFGSVHPDAPDALSELDRIVALGLKGIKLHPDYQHFIVEDPRVFPVYNKIQELGLPLVFHAGMDPVSPNCVHCTPEGLSKVAAAFPKLRIVAAHMGGAYMQIEAEKHLADTPNIHFDTAVMHEFLDPESFAHMVSVFGADRIFYATDLPWSSAPQIISIIEDAQLSDLDKSKIYFENAQAFFNLTNTVF